MHTNGSQFGGNPALSLSNHLAHSGGGLGGYLQMRASVAAHGAMREIDTAHTKHLNEHMAGLNMDLAEHSHKLGVERAGIDHSLGVQRAKVDAKLSRKNAAAEHGMGMERASLNHAQSLQSKQFDATNAVHMEQTRQEGTARQSIIEAQIAQSHHDHQAPERYAGRIQDQRMAEMGYEHAARMAGLNNEHAQTMNSMQFTRDRDLQGMKAHGDIQKIKAQGKQMRKTDAARRNTGQ